MICQNFVQANKFIVTAPFLTIQENAKINSYCEDPNIRNERCTESCSGLAVLSLILDCHNAEYLVSKY